MHLVYLVGRDREVFTEVRRCIEDAGYPVCWFLNPASMLVSVAKHPPSLLILHLESESGSTFDACRLIRASSVLREVSLLALGDQLTERRPELRPSTRARTAASLSRSIHANFSGT